MAAQLKLRTASLRRNFVYVLVRHQVIDQCSVRVLQDIVRSADLTAFPSTPYLSGPQAPPRRTGVADAQAPD
jgi:hypothetical protein